MAQSMNSVTMGRKNNSFMGRATAASILAAVGMMASVAGAEIIVLRSGQVGNAPGVAGQLDDTVTFLSGNNPPGTFISANAFTPAEFAGAATGPAATVINPHGAWAPGLSDTQARWINFAADLQPNPDGTMGGSGQGLPGSTLYAIPFMVNTLGATGGWLNMEFAADDCIGDWAGYSLPGGNNSGLYINGMATGYGGGNYATPTFHSQFIPFTTGLNHIYLYQRDAGVLVSGIIFSITIDVVPAPGSAALLGMGTLVAMRRRR